MTKGKEDKVSRLYKAFYGLKQAPKAWNNKIDSYFDQNSFERCQSKPSLYVKKKGEDFVMICLYIDDLIHACSNIMLERSREKERELLHYITLLRREVPCKPGLKR